MREAIIQRPVTVAKLAAALANKPYWILSIFPSPNDSIDDSVAMDIAAMAEVHLQIINDQDDGMM